MFNSIAKFGVVSSSGGAGGAAGPIETILELRGGGGGGGSGAGGVSQAGNSGRVKGTFSFPIGTELRVIIATGGGYGTPAGGGAGGTGFGNGGNGTTQDGNQGSGGGGGSSSVEILVDSTLLAVASGGGGATTHSGSGSYARQGEDATGNNSSGTGTKNGAHGTAPGTAPTGSLGGGGAGANAYRDGGGGSLGGESYVNTTVYSGVSSTATIARAAGGLGTVSGGNGSIEITDGTGKTTYSTPGTYTHTISGSSSSSSSSVATALLLMHMDGTNTSTTFLDSGANGLTLTAGGTAQLTTSKKKFGTAGGSFLPSGGYVTVPHHASFDFGTGDFTIEWFQEWASLAGYQTLWNHGYVGSNALLISVPGGLSGTGRYGVFISGGDPKLTEGSSPTTGVVYHYAVVRASGVMTIYRDGVATASGTVTNTISNAADIIVGAGNNLAFPLNGYLDDLRVSGSAIYTGAFTPPTAPFISSSSSSGSTEEPAFAHYVRWDANESGNINLVNGTWTSSSTGLNTVTLQNKNGGSNAPFSYASSQNGRNVVSSPINRRFVISSGADATSRTNYSIILVFAVRNTASTGGIPLLVGNSRGFELNGNGGTSANRIDFIGGSGNDRTISQTGIGYSSGVRRVIGVSYNGTSGLHAALAYSSLAGSLTLGTSGSNQTGGLALLGGGAGFEFGGYTGGGPTISIDDYDLCELIFYSTNLTQTQLDEEGNRLKTKWGV